jgi:hypothetical protein
LQRISRRRGAKAKDARELVDSEGIAQVLLKSRVGAFRIAEALVHEVDDSQGSPQCLCLGWRRLGTLVLLAIVNWPARLVPVAARQVSEVVAIILSVAHSEALLSRARVWIRRRLRQTIARVAATSSLDRRVTVSQMHPKTQGEDETLSKRKSEEEVSMGEANHSWKPSQLRAKGGRRLSKCQGTRRVSIHVPKMSAAVRSTSGFNGASGR